MARRAAVLALGLLGDYNSNATLGRALHDADRGVRMLAESGIRHAVVPHRHLAASAQQLETIIELNATQRFDEAIVAGHPADRAGALAGRELEPARLALFNIGRFAESIHDCTQALEINPYHFGAATGMGQCHLKLNNRPRRSNASAAR